MRNMVAAVLLGGPDDIAPDRRAVYTAADSDVIKLVHRGGYEHFERTPGEGDAPVVFRWTSRTRMAE